MLWAGTAPTFFTLKGCCIASLPPKLVVTILTDYLYFVKEVHRIFSEVPCSYVPLYDNSHIEEHISSLHHNDLHEEDSWNTENTSYQMDQYDEIEEMLGYQKNHTEYIYHPASQSIPCAIPICAQWYRMMGIRHSPFYFFG